jgi:hypothetical protein
MALQFDDDNPVHIRYRTPAGLERDFRGPLAGFFDEHPGRCLETLTLFFEKGALRLEWTNN